ncbi:hypothetical protein AB6A23_23345 [Paenibacillus tarimensis]
MLACKRLQPIGIRPDYQLIYSSNAEKSAIHKDQTKKYKIGIVPKITGIDYFNAIEDGAHYPNNAPLSRLRNPTRP